MEIDDETIVAEMRKNRERGSESLLAAYRTRLMAAAVRLCGDESLAEDLVFSTVEAAVLHIDAYRGDSRLFEWLYGILLNIHRNSVRRKLARKIVYTDTIPEEAESRCDDVERLVHEIDGGFVRAAVEQLPPEQKEAVILHYFLDMSVRMIARFLTLPVGTVKSRLHYARLALAERLRVGCHKRAVIVGALLVAASMLAFGAYIVAAAVQKRTVEPTDAAVVRPIGSETSAAGSVAVPRTGVSSGQAFFRAATNSISPAQTSAGREDTNNKPKPKEETMTGKDKIVGKLAGSASALSLACAMSLGASAAEVAEVTDVEVSQDAQSRLVTVTYKIDKAAIVTLDIQTNGVSIGGVTHVTGDANKLVTDTSGVRTINWRPELSWPGHKIELDDPSAPVAAVVTAWATNAPPDYMSLEIGGTYPGCVSYYKDAASVPGGVTDSHYKTDAFLFRKIPAAGVCWRMGTPENEPGVTAMGNLRASERPHRVEFTYDYYMGVYEVTQAQFERVNGAGTNPSWFNNPSCNAKRPVENVKWRDLHHYGDVGKYKHQDEDSSFFGKMRVMVNRRYVFDFPTDAEWEYACRAGVGTGLTSGQQLETDSDILQGKAPSANLARVARYRFSGGFLDDGTEPARDVTTANGTAEVGSFEPNAWGLYDMLGNVGEFCMDCYSDSLQDAKDPFLADGVIQNAVFRGGSWLHLAHVTRCGTRSPVDAQSANKHIGFRVCATGL